MISGKKFDILCIDISCYFYDAHDCFQSFTRVNLRDYEKLWVSVDIDEHRKVTGFNLDEVFGFFSIYLILSTAPLPW
jgi:hypothetical protein